MNNAGKSKKTVSPQEREELLAALKARFEKNMKRHKDRQWARIEATLQAHPEKLSSLDQMERSGGEPDVVGQDKKTGEYFFLDCSAETRAARRGLCSDRQALEGGKDHKPKDS